MFTCIIHGDPVPLARPRLCKGHIYDSQVQKKAIFAWEVKSQMPNKLYFKEPIRLIAEFGMRMPVASKNKKNELRDQPCGKRPDLSNLVKFIEDACLGVLYDDDNIIVEISAKKIWVDDPYTKMSIIEI